MAVFIRGIVFLLKRQNRVITFLEKIWVSFSDGITNGSEEKKAKAIFFV